MAGTEWQFDRKTSICMDNLDKHNNDYESGIESHTSTAQKSCPKTHANAQTTHVRMLHLPKPFAKANRQQYRSSVPQERLHIGGHYPGFFRDAHSADGLDGYPNNRRWRLVREFWEVHRALVAPKNYSASNWCLLSIPVDFDSWYPSLYELHRRPPQRSHSCISTCSAMYLLFCARLSLQTWYQIKQSKITQSRFSTSEVSN